MPNVIPIDEAVKYLKESIVKTYGKKGQEIVEMNYKAVEAGVNALVKVDVPAAWANADASDGIFLGDDNDPAFIRNVVRVMSAQEGDSLPVSAFNGYEDGTFPAGTTAYEKRGIAVMIPRWIKENCIQCNQCSYVCPHATIRPFLLDAEEVKNAPAGFETVKATGKELDGLQYRIQVTPLDCTVVETAQKSAQLNKKLWL
jgi:pyruvate-ferredoxin/flavodoxin oxidoreductase